MDELFVGGVKRILIENYYLFLREDMHWLFVACRSKCICRAYWLN